MYMTPRCFYQQFKKWGMGKKIGLITTLTSFKTYIFVFIGLEIKFQGYWCIPQGYWCIPKVTDGVFPNVTDVSPKVIYLDSIIKYVHCCHLQKHFEIWGFNLFIPVYCFDNFICLCLLCFYNADKTSYCKSHTHGICSFKWQLIVALAWSSFWTFVIDK